MDLNDNLLQYSNDNLLQYSNIQLVNGHVYILDIADYAGNVAMNGSLSHLSVVRLSVGVSIYPVFPFVYINLI